MKLITLALLFISSAAWAEGSPESLSYFQPLAGKKSVLAQLSLSKQRTKIPGQANTDNSSQVFSTEFLYGLTGAHAIGVDLTYSKSKSEGQFASKEAGLDDVQFEYLGTHEFSSITLRYGADLNVSIGNQKERTSTQEGTPNSGGISLVPNLGVEIPVSVVRAGLNVSRSISGKRTIDNDTGSTTTLSGGETTVFTLYSEYNFGKGIVGVGYFISNTEKETEKRDGSTETYEGSKLKGLTLIGSFDLMPDQTLLGGITMGKNELLLSETTVLGFTVGYRAQF